MGIYVMYDQSFVHDVHFGRRLSTVYFAECRQEDKVYSISISSINSLWSYGISLAYEEDNVLARMCWTCKFRDNQFSFKDYDGRDSEMQLRI